MTNKEIKSIARAYKAFSRSKRTAILANLTQEPQTYEQLTSGLPPGNYRGALVDFIKAGLVRLCDKAATKKGFGEALTYAATQTLETCRAMKAEGLPAFSEAQTAMLIWMCREGAFTVAEIAGMAGISKTTAQHYMAKFYREGYVKRQQGEFKVGEPVFVYEISGGEGWEVARKIIHAAYGAKSVYEIEFAGKVTGASPPCACVRSMGGKAGLAAF